VIDPVAAAVPTDSEVETPRPSGWPWPSVRSTRSSSMAESDAMTGQVVSVNLGTTFST
jgi:hypothetical protein